MKNIYRNENSIIFKNDFLDFNTGVLLSPVETSNYVVLQVADSYYGSRFCLSEHKQQCDIEITYPLTNGLLCYNNQDEYRLNKYDIFLSYKDDLHELKSNRGCRFQTLALNVKKGSCTDILNSVKDTFSDKRAGNMQDIASQLASIMAEFVLTDPPFSNDYLDSLITSVLVKVARIGFLTPEHQVLPAEEKLPAIINYIDSHFLDICSLEDISEIFGYSYGHICKSFHKCYGVTPINYLISKKMDYAAIGLKKGESVKSIAEKLGYSNPYNFSRAFKKYYGVSPSKI